MTLRDLLLKKKSAIMERWLQDTLATYSVDASGFLAREKNPFANPVGRALRSGTRGIFESLLEETDAEEVCRHLDEIIKIRAIQDFSPSQAVSFVFFLKSAIRKELVNDINSARLSSELTEIDARIDQIALFAFDIYTRCREKVCELRVNEVKRSVSAVMERLGVDNSDQVHTLGMPGGETPWRGGGR